MIGKYSLSPAWQIKQSEVELSETLAIQEARFRLSQNPHLRFEDALIEAGKYARCFARKMVWC
jgi:hypothetical protein